MDFEYMTSDGLRKLETKLTVLEHELEELRLFKGEEAIHAGDTWHDNPVFYETEAKERALMRQVSEIKLKIHNAKIITPPHDTNRVQIGSLVEMRFSDGSIDSFRILGESDADPSSGIISYKSPLAKSILGHFVGDSVAYSVGNQEQEIIILSISL